MVFLTNLLKLICSVGLTKGGELRSTEDFLVGVCLGCVRGFISSHKSVLMASNGTMVGIY